MIYLEKRRKIVSKLSERLESIRGNWGVRVNKEIKPNIISGTSNTKKILYQLGYSDFSKNFVLGEKVPKQTALHLCH